MRAEPRLKSPLRRSLAVLTVAVAAGSLTTVATPASAATTWLQVSAGSNHTCGVTSAHDLYCWGNNSRGQLGTGNTTDRLVPTRVGAKGIWASVSAGYLHTCALDLNGRRYCWGYNSSGQLGYGDTNDRLTPTAADSATWTMISAGAYHACGIQTNGRAYCWGSDAFGQLGNNSTLNDGQRSPQRVQFNGQWSAISANTNATCGLDTNRTRYCWGDNTTNALGLGEESNTYITTPATWGNGTWRTVDPGHFSGCGVSQGRRLYCWGYNSEGQLGVGDTENRSEPTQVTGSNWTQVSMGTRHACGLKTDGTGYCWGGNDYGQLGSGPSGLLPNSTVPRVIGRLNDVVHSGPQTWSWLDAGSHHACGISTEGALYCWGLNDNGQLGDDTTTNRPLPRKVTEP